MASLLANSQSNNGNSVFVIYSRRPETPIDLPSYFSPKVELINIQMHSGIEKISSIHKIRSALLEISPHTVFMHSSFAGFLGRISSLFSLKNTKFYYIPHCISFMRADISSVTRMVFIALEWISALKKCDYIACSQSERIVIGKNIPFRKCHLVENAVEPPQQNIQRQSHRIKTVVTVGQLRKQKAPDRFREIAKLVRDIDSSVQFVWVGDGEADIKKELEDANIRVTGWLGKTAVQQTLNDADIYLSTARWEGMPVSIIEAIYSYLPVVASSCPGNIDVVEHESTGWLFDSNTEAAQHIVFALQSPEITSRIAYKAFDRAQERFSVQRYTSEMNKLLQSEKSK